jgi:3D (Asp-Asp-Asp) domain-containing protein
MGVFAASSLTAYANVPEDGYETEAEISEAQAETECEEPLTEETNDTEDTEKDAVTEETQTADLEEPAVPTEEMQLVSLGIFKTTAYCPCKGCSEGWGRHTSTGTVATAGRTIAVDPKIIPYGTRLLINGTIYTAEDKGGGVRGNHVDIFYDTHEEAKAHGTQNADVFLVLS